AAAAGRIRGRGGQVERRQAGGRRIRRGPERRRRPGRPPRSRVPAAEVRRSWFAGVALVAALATIAFLLVPLVAVFANVSPSRLIDALGEESAREALLLSLKTTLIALAIVVVVGTPTAYLLAARDFPGRPVVLTVIELALVMPPAVAGIALLAAFGPHGILGGAVSALGIELVFQTAGVVVALVFVSAPFFLRQAI